MKPLLLKIAGLNSFRQEQTVDFTVLSETGLFGIFGPTGSGKSTVLDGITLALYGNVERAKGGTQGIINQHEKNAYVQFTFSMGKNIFIAERSYKKNNDGGVNLHKCRLLSIIGGKEQVLAEKKSDMDRKIAEIIGLTFDDFTRAVVLPQGKFAEFLSLQGKERRLMLQRLFALEKYGVKLYEKVKEKLNKAKNELKIVQGKQNELGDASDEAVVQAKDELKKQEALVVKLKKREIEYQKRYEELKKIIDLKNELAKFQKEWGMILEQEAGFQIKRKRLELSRKAEKVKPYCQMVNNEKLTLQQLTVQLTVLAREVQQGEKLLMEAQNKYQELENLNKTKGKELETKLVRLEEALANEKARAELLKKREEIKESYLAIKKTGDLLQAEQNKLEKERYQLSEKKGDLTKLIQKKEQLAQLQEEYTAKKEAWLKFKEVEKSYQELAQDILVKEKQIKTICEKIFQLKKEKEQVNRELLEIKDNMNSLTIPELTQEELNKLQNDFNEFSEVISALEHYTQDLNSQEENLTQLQKEITGVLDDLNQESSKIKEITDSKLSLTEEIALLEKELNDLQTKNMALFLRENLKENEPCPVCGSLVHVIPEKEEKSESLQRLEEIIGQKQEELRRLEEQLNQSLNQKASLETKLELLEGNIKRIKEVQNNLAKKMEQHRKKLTPELAPLDFKSLQLWQKEQKQYLTQIQENLSSYNQSKEKYSKLLDEVTKKLNQIEQALTREETNRDVLGESLNQLQEKLEKLKSDKNKKEEDFLKKAEGMSGPEIEKKVQEIRKAGQELIQLRKEEKEIAERLEETIEKLFKIQKELQENVQKIESLEIEGKGYKEQIEQLTIKINQITSGKKAGDVKEEVEEELKVLNSNLEKSIHLLEENRKNYEKKKNVYSNINYELEKTKERLEKSEQQLLEKLNEHQFISQVEAEEALLTLEEMTALEKEIQEFTNRKLLIQKNLESLENKLVNKNLAEEEWQSFLKEGEKIKGDLEKAQEAYHKLAGHVERIEKNNIRYRQLEEEKKQWEKLLDKLMELEKLFRGNTFVEFIAEEQLIKVSLEASRQLADLTQSRYALVVDSEGGFIIRDDANGGLYRPVSTLSGGETFLTSLALALALSSQIQIKGKYPLEFFFLDEGFGTLDGHLLETVMNSLEKLKKQKMTIGVISHVPELRSRLQRRLIVTPAEKGGQGTQLEIEVG